MFGLHSGNGVGVLGGGVTGVKGESNRDGGIGVSGRTTSTSSNSFGVKGESNAGTGVYGRSDRAGIPFEGGVREGGIGVHGENNLPGGIGVLGQANALGGIGVKGMGVFGVKGEGVVGVEGKGLSSSNTGVAGHSSSGIGVDGNSSSGIGVRGNSSNSVGVWAEGRGPGLNGAAFRANNSNASGIGIFSTTKSNDANLVLTNEGRGDLIRGFSGAGGSNLVFRVRNNGIVVMREMQTRGADLAERFEFSEEAKPGMVVAIDPDNPGKLRIARGAYNPTVAGVISGANDLSAGIVLSQDTADGYPVALSGRVWVYCDASEGAITPGALLTTAERHGYAMAVRDHKKAPGAVIGKAMTSLKKGTGLVLVLVTLQ